MNRSDIFAAISHMDGLDIQNPEACELFAESLAEVAEKISNESMRRFLLVGAYLYRKGQEELDQGLEV